MHINLIICYSYQLQLLLASITRGRRQLLSMAITTTTLEEEGDDDDYVMTETNHSHVSYSNHSHVSYSGINYEEEEAVTASSVVSSKKRKAEVIPEASMSTGRKNNSNSNKDTKGVE